MLQRSLRSPSFAAKVGLVTLVPIVVLAVVLGKSLGGAIRAQSIDKAEREAELVAKLVGEDRLVGSARRGFSASAVRRMNRTLRPVLGGDGASRVAVLDRSGRVRYSTRQAAVGTRSQADLARALAGSTASRRTSGSLQVLVPLRAAAGSPPAAVLQMSRPYAPIQSASSADSRTLYLILLVGLGVLWAGLLRIVVGASARLKHQAAENEHQALRDTLTELPNRALFNRLLEQALAECPSDGHVAVLLMDLDRFKEINDTLGHFNGDRVIERVSERLSTVLREGDIVARLGGDEFAMLLPRVTKGESAVKAAKRVHAVLEEPFTAGGLALRVEASIGIAMYPTDGDKGGTLLRAADVAMYAAKKAHTGHELYSPDQQQYSPAKLGLVAQLSRAMDKHELVLHYQPKARLSTGSVEGVEALVRWNHPQQGLLKPDEFIPVTEHTSMIRPVTIYLLETALEQAREWEREGQNLSVAVNLSTQILLDLDLPKEIERMLSRVGGRPHKLELEITESAIMYDPRRAQVVLESLHDMGLRIAIDDFGTGYSSLVSLKQLPVSTIKIDKSFVLGMEEDEHDAAIVKSTAQLGANLGLEVVAEGVETPSVWAALADLGCDYAQGFYLSKPVDSVQFGRWLLAYREMFGAPGQAPALPNSVRPGALNLGPSRPSTT